MESRNRKKKENNRPRLILLNVQFTLTRKDLKSLHDGATQLNLESNTLSKFSFAANIYIIAQVNKMVLNISKMKMFGILEFHLMSGLADVEYKEKSLTIWSMK